MEEDGPKVTISNGTLRGRVLVTDTGFKYFSFQGVPYAKPPVGNLRFKAPEPAEPWQGVKDAVKEGNECTQQHMEEEGIIGSENCLFINIYTPSLESESNLPVMVFIHGGAFIYGSGNADLLGPDYLVEEDVVLVTFNYRIGPLGFLSSGDEKVPGNAGLKDQVAALKWTQENIKHFGGNPNNVTLFGSSAGAASVHYLMLSDRTNGLFHKAIAQSGSALNPWARQRNPKKNVLNLSAAMGYKTDDLEEALNFLQTAPAAGLNLPRGPSVDIFPVIEVPSSEDSIITEEPLEIIRQGKFKKIPFLCGFSSDEGLIVLDMMESLNPSFGVDMLTASDCVPKEVLKEEESKAWDKIKEFYFEDGFSWVENPQRFQRLKTDTEFVYGINKMVKEHLKVSDSPLYYYRYNFDRIGTLKKMLQIDYAGVCHGDELCFIFRCEHLNFHNDEDATVRRNQKLLTKMWTNFAKTGNPTPTKDDLINVEWRPARQDFLDCLNIGEELKMMTHPHAKRLAFLEELYHTHGSSEK